MSDVEEALREARRARLIEKEKRSAGLDGVMWTLLFSGTALLVGLACFGGV